MNLAKYIGKIDRVANNINDHIDPDYPVFTDGKDFYWYKVEYTENDEVVIRDTCGRTMPLALEVCAELATLLYNADQLLQAQESLEDFFHSPTSSTF